MSFSKFLGIHGYDLHERKFLLNVVFVRLLGGFTLYLSSTFFILYAIDEIGFAEASFMTSVQLISQFIFDYPSGSLGDYIGQRWVLITSYTCYAIAFLFLISADSLFLFMVVAFFNGIGAAQGSGAIETWLDNNYKKISIKLDPERKIYGFYTSRFNALDALVLSSSFIIGGIISSLFNRKLVFLGQVFLIMVLIIVVYLLVHDLEFLEFEDTIKKSSSKNYFNFLKGGLIFLFSSKTAFLFMIGISLLQVAGLVWGTLVLFPMYYGYSGSDSTAGLLRSIIFLNGVLIRIYLISYLSKKLSASKQPFSILIHSIFFYPIIMLLLYVIPPNNSFNLTVFIIIIILQNTLTTTLTSLEQVLRSKFMLDFIPSENRNAAYSLNPTLYALCGFFLLPMSGIIVDQHGLIAGVFLAMIISLFSFLFISLAHLFNSQPKESLVSDKLLKIIS
ncbi:MAG: MFS transporter [Candidatus Hodarchaeales archaeon]|jgi:MFS family permease